MHRKLSIKTIPLDVRTEEIEEKDKEPMCFKFFTSRPQTTDRYKVTFSINISNITSLTTSTYLHFHSQVEELALIRSNVEYSGSEFDIGKSEERPTAGKSSAELLHDEVSMPLHTIHLLSFTFWTC
jgi:hypothetical protein